MNRIVIDDIAVVVVVIVVVVIVGVLNEQSSTMKFVFLFLHLSRLIDTWPEVTIQVFI